MIDVCLLGTGGMMPLPGRWLTSLLLRFNGKMYLIDCGEGTQIPLKLAGWGFKAIDAIFITHFHADHVAGLPGLLLTIGNSGKDTPLDLVGPPGLMWVAKSLLAICPALPYEVRVVELPIAAPASSGPSGNSRAPGAPGTPDASSASDDSDASNVSDVSNVSSASNTPDASSASDAPDALIDLSPHVDIELYENLSFQYALCDHNIPCYAYSFQIRRQGVFNPTIAKELDIPLHAWKQLQMGGSVELPGGRTIEPSMVLGPERRGVKLSYCTDTRPNPALRKLFCKSDLLICEGMYGGDSERDNARDKKHMLFSEAAKLARDAGALELWLTHYSPSLQNPSEYIGEARRYFANTYTGRDLLMKTLKFKD